MVLGFLANIASKFVPIIGTLASKVGQTLATIAPQAVKTILSNPIVKTIAGVTAGSAIAGVPLPELGRTAIGTTAATVIGGPIAGGAVLISKAAQEVSTALRPQAPMTPLIPTSTPSTEEILSRADTLQKAAMKTSEALTPIAPELGKDVGKIPSAIETIKDLVKKPEIAIPIAAATGAAVGAAIVRRLRRKRRTRKGRRIRKPRRGSRRIRRGKRFRKRMKKESSSPGKTDISGGHYHKKGYRRHFPEAAARAAIRSPKTPEHLKRALRKKLKEYKA